MKVESGQEPWVIFDLKDILSMSNYCFSDLASDRQVLYSNTAWMDIPSGPRVEHVMYALTANSVFTLYSNAVEFIDNLFKQNSHANYLVWRRTPEIKKIGGMYNFYMRLSFATHEKQTNI